jgi:hypothetical protein
VKKTIIFAIMFIMAAGVFFGGYKAGAAGGGAGSASDPLITKSYLEARLAQALGTSGGYVKVAVAKNGRIRLSETGQLFLYSGAGTVSDGKFVDLSSGDLFSKGNVCVKYNIFFAAGGSAVIQAGTDSVFYVLGPYTLESE